MASDQSVSAAGWPGRVLSWLARRPCATLALLCVLLAAPGVFSLPPLDRDESRFAESSRQMLESGNFIDIRFGHVPRYKKPIGIYWLQAVSTAIAGFGDRGQIWTYRLPSLLGGLLAVLLTFWLARAFLSPEEAWLAAALLGMTLLMTVESTIATTDAVQLACLAGTMGVLIRAYLAAREQQTSPLSTRLVLVGWASLAAGILVKGPVVPAVSLLTVAALVVWDRDWQWLKSLKPLLGVPLTLAIIAPWGIAIALASHGQFFQQSLGLDFAAKLAGGQETHGGWPGYYLLLLTVSFWPAVLFLAPALGSAGRSRSKPGVRFLLAWIAPSWLMFELVPTKLPHYVLPLYPALAVLAAMWILARRNEDEPAWQKGLSYLGLLQFLVGLAIVSAAPVMLPERYGAGTTTWLVTAGAGCALLGLGALVSQFMRARIAAAGLVMLAVLLAYPAIAVGVAPRLEQLWISQRATVLVAAHARPGDPPPALAGYTEPSLMFRLGSETRMTNGIGAAEVGASQGGLALVEDSERAPFLARLAEVEADATRLDELSGFNYSRGRKVHITLYRVTATHDVTEPPAE